MKKNIHAILCLLGFSSLLGAKEPHDNSKNLFEGLRKQVITLKLDKIGIDPKKYKNQVYAILMETVYGDVTASLVSIADGTTSLYFSNGGGIIGAGEYSNVKKAALKFIVKSEEYLKSAKLTTVFPLPKKGEVKFYLISKKGIYTYTASENKLGNRKDKFSELFYAAQYVISEIRKTQEKIKQ